MNAATAITDSGIRRLGRRIGSWVPGWVVAMAPKKKGDPKQIDWNAMTWRGFVTAFLGLIAAIVTYIATSIGNLPPLWSDNKAEMKEINKRLANLEENAALARQFGYRVTDLERSWDRLDQQVKALIKGINTVSPSAGK